MLPKNVAQVLKFFYIKLFHDGETTQCYSNY